MTKGKPSRADRRLARQRNPERAAKAGMKAGTKDAWCTECEEDYDTSDQAALNRHAH